MEVERFRLSIQLEATRRALQGQWKKQAAVNMAAVLYCKHVNGCDKFKSMDFFLPSALRLKGLG